MPRSADGPRIQGIKRFEMGKGFDEPTAFILVHDLREAPIVRCAPPPRRRPGAVQLFCTHRTFHSCLGPANPAAARKPALGRLHPLSDPIRSDPS